MSFWGVQIQPDEPFTEPEPEGVKLHVTHATLGLESKGKKRTVVKCEVGDRPELLLCSLIPGVLESCSLDLHFDEEVVFTVSGDASVHLTGYYESHEDHYDSKAAKDYVSEDGYEFSDDDSDETYDLIDDEALSDEDYDTDDYSDDDIPVPSSVRIEEVNEDHIASAGQLKMITDGTESKKRKKDQVSKKEADKSAVKSAVEDGDGDSSEDEDGFALPGKHSDSKCPVVFGMNSTQIPSKMEGAFDFSTDGKKKKKKKEKPVKMQQAAKEENIKTLELMADGEVQQFAAPSKGVNKTPKSITEKKMGAKQGTVEIPNKQASWEMPQLAVPVKGNGKTPAKTPMEERVATKQGTVVKPSKTESSVVKKHSNGLNIEDITMGKSDGKQAKPGKRVSMRYIGKLVSNGKIFDSNIGKKPFDFRLGAGEVIKGWDIGVNGMRVGDKRRLTIPPQMAYGPEGVKGTIPGNAWLTFDVELVAVK
ncbi:hypothetical protein BDL97_03G108600 [Sphagnum fallax]|nr:hypothetical protein BDL97_03G108600 [Sphagnum fallax]KAH8968040.1 hypothetical protein BDL97_03G108600 [Sphagnum fallax]